MQLRFRTAHGHAELLVLRPERRRDDDGTWITAEVFDAYNALHRQAHAHSIEVWAGDALAGGLYGVSMGRMFYGESMFARVPDASKVALAYLVRQLARWQFEMIDCQMTTPHLASLGAREIPRREFVARLRRLTAAAPLPGPWRLDPDLEATF